MTVINDLNRFGPKQREAVSSADAQAYCRRLAKTQYENFTVASWLLPGRLRQHFYNLYAYCRWADDLADETGDPARSLELLAWWEQQVHDCYAGTARHPVFVALAETIRQFDLPRRPLLDLLAAFRRDQSQTRYETVDDLLSYCACSANPVGRLVLALGESASEENFPLSDCICTGLQLANFCQDVARDFDRGRIYLPQAACRRHGYSEEMFRLRLYNCEFCELLRGEVERAEQFLLAGRPLVDRVPRWLRIDISLFLRGGLAILQEVRRQRYDVWSRRPTVGKWKKFLLLVEGMRA